MYGVLKGFMELMLADYTGDCPAPVIPRKLRNVMHKRGELLRLTADFGRPYKWIVRSSRSYQLDDWLHFLETLNLFILQRNILTLLMQSMLDKLRYSHLHNSCLHSQHIVCSCLCLSHRSLGRSGQTAVTIVCTNLLVK